MKCPRCQTPLTKAVARCGQCGLDFPEPLPQKMAVYLDLKAQVDYLQTLSQHYQNSLLKVQQRLTQWQNLLAGDLRRTLLAAGPATAPAAEPRPPVTPSPAGEPHRPAAPEEPIAAPAGPAAAQTVSADISRPAAAAAPAFTTAPARRDHSGLEVKLGQKVILIVGVVVMVFAVAYFLKYSFDQGWVGPAGRVAAVFFWGAALLAAGEAFRRKSFPVFGLCLAGGGIAVLYFASFAGFQIYALFSQELAFGVMVLITLLAATLAVVYDNVWLAALGLVGGFMTPILLSTGTDNHLVLFSYLTLLNLALLGIAFWRRWTLLNALGFFFTYVLYMAWVVSHYTSVKFWPAILFLNAFYLIYTLIPLAYHWFSAGRTSAAGFWITIPNSFLAFGFSYAMVADRFEQDWASLISLAYALVFLLLATFHYRRIQSADNSFVLLLSKASLFLIITIPILFSEHWVTIFWLVQGLCLLWLGAHVRRPGLMVAAALLVLVGVTKFAFYDYAFVFDMNVLDMTFQKGYTHLLDARLITSVTVLATLFAFAVLARRHQASAAGLLDVLRILAVTGFGMMLFLILNVETVAFFEDILPRASLAALSVLWTLFSVGLIVKGFLANNVVYRILSMGLFVVTLFKVFLLDMAEVSTPYRIISFFVLGIVLVGVSYLYHRYRDKIIRSVAQLGQKETPE